MIKTLFLNELITLISNLKYVFDVVRVVDPINCKLLDINLDTPKIAYEEYVCYQTWNKNSRCDNCISMSAYHDNTRKTKYEFVNDDIYNVISLPFILCNNGENQLLCIEMVNKVTDEIMLDAFGREEFIDKILDSNIRLYEDALTLVYNRRFFSERKFVRSSHGDISKTVAFVMLDLTNFKSINDTYGHETGDNVLRQVGKILADSVNNNEYVIRLSGDEFLLILDGRSESEVLSLIENLKEAFKNIVYDTQSGKYVIGNFGYSYTATFTDTSDFVADMLREADKQMYIDKNNMKI